MPNLWRKSLFLRSGSCRRPPPSRIALAALAALTSLTGAGAAVSAATPRDDSDAKPSAAKPSDNKPSDNKPSDNKPSDNKPSDTKPSDAKPSDAKPGAAAPFDPIVRQLEGWTVHVEPALLSGPHQEEGAAALRMLANHLQRIAIVAPADRLAQLQKIELWMERRHPKLGAMQYHPSVEWLKEHGHDPRLAKKVHITRASELLSRQQMLKHPAVILHELAHGYHDQFLGFDEPRIQQAYQEAMKAGTYEKVLLYDGREVRHYGATNHKEYFAEATEAYFYRNDFFPFVAAELQRHDPGLYDLFQEIWGPLK